MSFGSCNPSGRWDEVLVHESEDAIIDLLEFSFHFSDVFLRVRRELLVVLLSLLCAICSFLSAVSAVILCFLLSLGNLLDLNLHLLFFVLRNPPLQSTWLLQRSITVCCPFCCFCVTSFHTSSVLCCCSSSDFLTVCTWFSQLGCFLLLNFNLRSNLNLVFSCFLGSLPFLLCCNVLMTFSILVFSSSVQLTFFETLFSSYVSACSWRTALSGLLILSCCWVRSFRLRLAVLFCLLLALLFCHFVPLSEIVIDLLLVVVQVLRLLCSFSAIWLCLFR